MASTPTAQLADLILGDAGPLEDFVRSRRAEARAWRLIARDLYEVTGQRIDVTYETLRSWYPDPDETAAETEAVAS
jgi:hypothetical protein